jgi:hypothetical protein
MLLLHLSVVRSAAAGTRVDLPGQQLKLLQEVVATGTTAIAM